MKTSSRNQRLMTRGSMIALNLLEKDLGIENSKNKAANPDNVPLDIDQLLESIVGSTSLREYQDEVHLSLCLSLSLLVNCNNELWYVFVYFFDPSPRLF